MWFFLLTPFTYFTYQFYEIDLENTYKLYFTLLFIVYYFQILRMKTENLTNHLNQSLDRFSRFVIYGIQKTQQRTKSNQSKLHIDENCFLPKTAFYLKNVKSSETGMVI